MSANFYPLIKSAYLAHKEFHAVWKAHYTDTKKVEPSEVTRARDLFNIANDRLFDELNKYDKSFFDGEPEAINSILNFLEVGIPAFRCGYAKQKYFRKLKSFQLNDIQKQRIAKLAYNQCLSENYRVEFRDLARLMIKIADNAFVKQVSIVRGESEGVIKFKSSLMLQTILQNRKDLNIE